MLDHGHGVAHDRHSLLIENIRQHIAVAHDQQGAAAPVGVPHIDRRERCRDQAPGILILGLDVECPTYTPLFSGLEEVRRYKKRRPSARNVG